MAKRLALLGFAVFFVGAVLGVTLLLSERTPVMRGLAAIMLVVGIVVPLVLLAKAAACSGGRVAFHVVPAIVFWPLGLIFALANILERCREHEISPQK
jgi:hypothetical protein